MFIDVSRFAGGRVLRLAVAAIAYLDEAPGGCAIHLLGSETLRVAEKPEEIEARIDALMGPEAAVIGPIDDDQLIALAEAVADARPPILEATDLAPEMARRRGKRA
jgi:hypothetical protein